MFKDILKAFGNQIVFNGQTLQGLVCVIVSSIQMQIHLNVIPDDRFQDSHRPGYGVRFDESRICRSRPPKHYIPNNYWNAKIRGRIIYHLLLAISY